MERPKAVTRLITTTITIMKIITMLTHWIIRFRLIAFSRKIY